MSAAAILKPGRNCWRIEYADRVSLLVDGADYFYAFRECAKLARHSLLVIGWDIDGSFKLERPSPGDGLPVNLRDFLDSLASRWDTSFRRPAVSGANYGGGHLVAEPLAAETPAGSRRSKSQQAIALIKRRPCHALPYPRRTAGKR